MLLLLIYFLLSITLCGTTGIQQKENECLELPEIVLEEILGAAFNARYMSIDQPLVQSGQNSRKRKIDSELDFYVDSDYQVDLEEPAWQLTNHVDATLKVFGYRREKRDSNYHQEWHCRSKIKWTDLGPDYFPRYLRTVECLTQKCWFNIYKCKPRSFTVKLLRRRRGRCVSSPPGSKIGSAGLPSDLKELWVWEERAVNFCCDCSM